MARPRVLFVIGHLVQSGAERFTYEVLRAIDREKFDVALLTKGRIRPNDFYYRKIQDLGIPVHRRLPLWYSRLQRHARPFYLALRPLIDVVYRLYAKWRLGKLLEQYDVINAIQLENYYALQPVLKDNEKVITYLMAHRFQYNYEPFDDAIVGRRYRFAIFDPIMREEYDQSPIASTAEEIHFPLVIDLSAATDLSQYARVEPPYRIGVFVRLAPDRPLAGILKAFAALRAKGADAELWLYGRGNPELFAKQIDELGIRDRVSFRGHTTSIEKTLREDGLSMVWMTSYGPVIAYASIEVGGYGFPTIFWNQHGTVTADQIREQTNGAIESYFDPGALANATYAALQDPQTLRERGKRLRAHVMQRNHIAGFIRGLEEKIAGVAAGRA
ncbi:MAG TPA: glycosyltransferase [Thermoanaerobaculia bacterium]|nr:glycosyltransferase [Thermoanaerobaculia bacterium]